VRSDDPVVFFEPKALFRTPADMPDEWPAIPFGKAAHLQAGDDVTVVAWAQAMPAARTAAAELAASGHGVDLFDLRTLWPWDEAAVCRSVARTRRLLVVQEAVTVSGFGAEIVARVSERLGPGALKAVARLGQPRVPVPFAPPLEDALKPDAAKTVAAAEKLLAA
jgi:pyruvate dehydrogenase E1 component beta subunit